MRRYSLDNPPPEAVWQENWIKAKAKGLTDRAATAYATLTWWGEHYGIRTPEIVSGLRDPKKQAEMRARWDRGDRRGLVVRPAASSAHTRGEAFDLTQGAHLTTLGALAQYAGLRWGGTFRDSDPVHFDLGNG